VGLWNAAIAADDSSEPSCHAKKCHIHDGNQPIFSFRHTGSLSSGPVRALQSTSYHLRHLVDQDRGEGPQRRQELAAGADELQ
jgi:hypothetical protein